MKAVQITKNNKDINVELNEIKRPKLEDHEVLIAPLYAAVNPLDLMNINGSVNLIQNYKMPLTLGNEVVGKIVEVGAAVKTFAIGDQVYSRLPLYKIGAFSEYVAVTETAIWHTPNNLTAKQAVAIPLTGLTAYQALTEELKVEAGKTVFISGGSGSFGQIAVPLAKAMGLKVIVSGNTEAREHIINLGADQYLDYKKENYWEILSDIDYVIDTLGVKEIEHEMGIMRAGGRLLSLISGPNKSFARDHNFPKWKQLLFGLAGAKLDKLAKKYQVEYRFIFVRESGQQLSEITKIVEDNNIIPAIDQHNFTLDQTQEALKLVAAGGTHGKVVISFDKLREE
ncbi:NADP-dependent oxidoreductase [Weissella kandleri]|uniref:NADP-dependent oxidoreductase n=1 Tax=Weissella kandleri TaxID=1616 RepID=UPI00387E5774